MRNIFRMIIIFFIIILNLSGINFAETNNISQININIDIKKDGSAEISEVWKVEIYSRNRAVSFF